MSLVIPDEVVSATHLSEAELRRELAILMYRDDRLSLGKACEFAGISHEEFLKELGARKIPIHYGLPELERDIAMVAEQQPR